MITPSYGQLLEAVTTPSERIFLHAAGKARRSSQNGILSLLFKKLRSNLVPLTEDLIAAAFVANHLAEIVRLKPAEQKSRLGLWPSETLIAEWIVSDLRWPSGSLEGTIRHRAKLSAASKARVTVEQIVFDWLYESSTDPRRKALNQVLNGLTARKIVLKDKAAGKGVFGLPYFVIAEAQAEAVTRCDAKTIMTMMKQYSLDNETTWRLLRKLIHKALDRRDLSGT